MFAGSWFEDEVDVAFCEVALDEEILRQFAGFLGELRVIVREEESLVEIRTLGPLFEESIPEYQIILLKNIDHECNTIKFLLEIRT